MHREFRTLLGEAQGVSEFLISVFADIRGFSSFSQQTESPDAAMYIKRVYARLIDEYFPSASFYKPTGDGLMVIIPYREQTLVEVSAATVRSALACVEAFPNICHDDPMINFPVPDRIGLGIARGTACRLFAGDKTLDYSGRLLNLAARLMNLARPSGIVIDGDFRREMIPEPERTRFKEARVYLRGVAEITSRLVYRLESVVIPQENLKPFGVPVWKTAELKTTVRELRRLASLFLLRLPSPPDDPNRIVVTMTHPLHRGGKLLTGHTSVHTLTMGKQYSYQQQAEAHQLRFNIGPILEILKAGRIPGKDAVIIAARYAERLL